MLITRIYEEGDLMTINTAVNIFEIDTILIHNLGETKKKGYWRYEIIDPYDTTKRLIKKTVVHKRSLGYRPLLIKCLQMLEDKNIESKPVEVLANESSKH